ncbi:hypothetical protein AVEN_154985-1 [Araneus ventricosus]|uniref:Uncharacterized protein n=1 Tax=Araneus ventricosus TaxID=182803 RepID=A0A4Y2A9R5_ARAVE|nr:hypothetical protein AVEN_154985-1 [Araneus ventricosus]
MSSRQLLSNSQRHLTMEAVAHVQYLERQNAAHVPVPDTITISRETGFPYSTVRKVLRNIMHFFPYKIHFTQQTLDRDKPQRLAFAVVFPTKWLMICHGS